MPVEKKPVQVSPDKHFVEYEGTSIEIPKPLEQMTEKDWVRLASGSKSPFRKISVDNQSFLGLHVVLKDKNYIPVWLYDGPRRSEVPRAFDTLERAVNMGAELVSTTDDIEIPHGISLSADGHIRRDDVVLAKVPIVIYYALQAQNIRKSKTAIEYKSSEERAYEGVDLPRSIGHGNKSVPVYESTEHSVQYQDRPRF
jgi:hypothetical protein